MEKQLDCGFLERMHYYMPQLDKERDIRIWLPPDYHEAQDKRYPVIYMHDGQYIFEEDGWDVHHAICDAMERYAFEGAIVVGVDHAPGMERLDELSPWVCERLDEMKASGKYQRDIGGLGSEYATFIIQTLKPYIDGQYRTRPEREHTMIAGSSMGGLMSLYMGLTYPHIFGKVGAFSSAIWFADQAMSDAVYKMRLELPVKWYMDIGTEETNDESYKPFRSIYLAGTLEIERLFREMGIPESQLRVVVEEGGTHRENAWRRRFPAALRWSFGLGDEASVSRGM